MLGTTRSRRLTSTALALAAAAALASTATAAADPIQDPIPVGPNMYFIGLVNGKTSQATITVVCPGPVTGTSTGHPTSGQKLEVRSVVPPLPTAFGYTGSAAHSIDAFFGPSSTTASPVVLTSFFAPVAIPTTLNLPCSGTGTVTFVPMPTSSTARSVSVSVTYVNIGA